MNIKVVTLGKHNFLFLFFKMISLHTALVQRGERKHTIICINVNICAAFE